MTPTFIRYTCTVGVCVSAASGIATIASTSLAQQHQLTGQQFTTAKKPNLRKLPQLPKKEAVSKKFGDWTKHCLSKPGVSEKRCVLTQTVLHAKDNKKTRLLAITIGLIGEEKMPVIALRVPLELGVLLPPGFKLNVPGIESARIIIESCLPLGCIAKMPLSPNTLAAMKKAQAGSIEVHTLRRQVLKVPVSFKGFTAAMASLSVG